MSSSCITCAVVKDGAVLSEGASSVLTRPPSLFTVPKKLRILTVLVALTISSMLLVHIDDLFDDFTIVSVDDELIW